MFGRIAVAAVSIPLLVWMVLKGEISFFLFVNFIIAVGLYEFYKMIENKGIKVYQKMGIAAGVSIPVLYTITRLEEVAPYLKNERFSYIILSLMIVGFMTRQVISGEIKEAMPKIAYTLFGVVYVSFMITHILYMKDIGADYGNQGIYNGRYWIMAVFLMVWASDSAAYFIGIAFGKNRLAPKISPKKSIEGAVAGLLAPIAVMFWLQHFLLFKGSDIGIINTVVIGLIVGIFGQIGDLGESLFKREFEIKDSGKILLGHGGILDRFDSMIFVMPLVYYYVKYVVVLNLFQNCFK